MNFNQSRKSGSSLDAQIRAINLSDRDRKAALQTASFAEVVADVVIRVVGRSGRREMQIFAKPELR